VAEERHARQREHVEDHAPAAGPGPRPNVARTYYVHPEHADAVAAEDLLVGDPVVLSEYLETKDNGGTARDITAKVLTMGTVISERLLFGSGTSTPDKALIKAAMPGSSSSRTRASVVVARHIAEGLALKRERKQK